jgi:adenosylhomocysteinase
MGYDVRDLGMAAKGRDRIEWAGAEMPVLGLIRERFDKERPLEGIRIAACLHVTSETANLMETLAAGGAEVGLCASNPLSTQDDVAAALYEGSGIQTFAIKGEDTDTFFKHINAVLDMRPQITMDDGADVIGVLHSTRRDQLDDVHRPGLGAGVAVVLRHKARGRSAPEISTRTDCGIPSGTRSSSRKRAGSMKGPSRDLDGSGRGPSMDNVP